MGKSTLSRRGFLGGASSVVAYAAVFPYIISSSVFGKSSGVVPSNRITLRFIGVGDHGTDVGLHPLDVIVPQFLDKIIVHDRGPKDRPALVTKVETRAGIVDVEIAYGTSQGIDVVHPGEFVVRKGDPDAGLQHV